MKPTAYSRTVMLTNPSPTTSTVHKILQLTEENTLLVSDNNVLLAENKCLKKALARQQADWDVYRTSYEKLALDNVRFATENAQLRQLQHNAQFVGAVEKSNVATQAVEERETEAITKQLDKLFREVATESDFHELEQILLAK